MSRSYRKPWRKDGYGSKRKRWMKRYANKIIRKKEDVPNGNAYKKVGMNQWDLCDYRYYEDSKPTTYWSWIKKEWVTEIFTPHWKARRK